MQQAAAGGDVQSGMDEMVEDYQEKFGLDDPLWKQYLIYLGDVARLDFGYSIANYPANRLEDDGLGAPLDDRLAPDDDASGASCIGTLLGALLGLAASPACIQYLFPPLLTLSAIPFFLLGLILIYLFAFQWPMVPALRRLHAGYASRVDSWTLRLDVLKHSFLPALSILLASMGFWALGMRGMMVTVEGEDFMTFAEASGLKNNTLFFTFAVRNALLPQTTALGLSLATILSGALLVEVIFYYPGVGGMLYNAIRQFDYFVIQGIIFTIVLASRSRR